MEFFCRLGMHRKVRIASYKLPLPPGSVTVTNGEGSPIGIELLGAWTFWDDERCSRCGTKWLNGRKVEVRGTPR